MTKQEKEQRMELLDDILAAIEKQYEAHDNDMDRYERGCVYGLLLAKSAVHNVLRDVINSEVD